jgi:hypothetical protein
MTVKNQHFVPRFYLNQFCFKENKIWVYNKVKRKSFSTSTENVACEKYFYDNKEFDMEKSTSQFIEKSYSEIESRFAPFYNQFINKLMSSLDFEVALKDRKIIADYLVTQIDRTREHIEETYQFTNEIYNQLKEKGFSEDQLFMFGFDKNEFDKKELHLESILAGDEMLNTFSEILSDHIWTIYKNDTSLTFYTSDQPIVKNGHIKDDFYSNEGYGSLGFEICFPLSPQYILILYDREYFNNSEYLDGMVSNIQAIENVAFYNSLQDGLSYRQIFSKENDFEIVNKIVLESPSSFNLDRKRIG